MTIELSIIVPVYNLERLLPKCIDSILAQTFTKFELILVNDGSSDKSGEICDVYACHDQRIKVIHKQNGGVSSARNTGLEAAKGDYVGFVDSDDYINKYMFATLFNNAIKHSSDIVVCGYLNVYEDQPQGTGEFDFKYRIQHYSNLEALNQMYKTKPEYIKFVVPWNKLYKRSLFENIKYEVGNIYDDETVAHKVLYMSEKLTYINIALYYYVQRTGSQMNSSFHIKRFDKVYALKDRATYFKKHKETDLYHKALKHYMDKFFWYYYLAKDNLQNIDKELVELKRTFDKSLICFVGLKGTSWKQRFMCVLFSVNPSVFELIKNQKTVRSDK